MAASVFYKFKSQKEPTRIEFDGTAISVFALKREIIVKSGLGDGSDFDLSIFSEDGKDEHQDDTEMIPRSTTVVARRLPASLGRGKGKAARYMTSKIPLHAKNQSRKEQAKQGATKPAVTVNPMAMMDPNMTEEEKMEAMFAAQSQHWSAQQEELSKQTKVHHSGPARKGAAAPDHPPADGYVCYRCGEKGHWIQNCPTNDDPNFENKRRIKRTTGIPRSFLKTVEKPVSLGVDDGGDGANKASGVMVNADGEFVVAEPDKASWEKFQAKAKSSAAAQKAVSQGDKELQDRGLECSIDMRLFIDPMKTPCCEKTFCNDCITNALIESDFTCPGCQTEGVLIDDLKHDEETSAKIKEYLAEKASAKKDKERSKSPPVVTETTPSVDLKRESPSPNPISTATKKSPEPAKSTSKSPPTSSSTPNLAKPQPQPNPIVNKKRPADELLENPKIPKGPKAMQQKQVPQMPPNMPGFGGFPPMPFDMSQNFYGNNGFGGMPNMMNFPMGMPNQMMMNPMMMGNNFGGFPNMPMNNMYGASNGNNFAGGMNMNNMNGMNMMNGGGMGRGGPQPNPQGGAPTGQFPNQQKTVFADPLPNEEDAYFRKPVNPHRHQGRQRRARPSDYREM